MICITIFTGYGYAAMLNSKLKGTAAGSLYWQTTCSWAEDSEDTSGRHKGPASCTIHFVLVPKVSRIQKTLDFLAIQHLQLILFAPSQLPCSSRGSTRTSFVCFHSISWESWLKVQVHLDQNPGVIISIPYRTYIGHTLSCTSSGQSNSEQKSERSCGEDFGVAGREPTELIRIANSLFLVVSRVQVGSAERGMKNIDV